jgi:23S rRNA pseudoU1915 N3-methylase RlmH
MKLLSITLGENKYMSGKITAYLTREALKLQRDALGLGDQVRAMTESANEAEAQEVLDAVVGLMDRKVWLICEAYGNKFTPDELEKTLASEEIDQEVNRIINVASGVIEKN